MTLLAHDELDQISDDDTNDYKLFLRTSNRLSNQEEGVAVVWKDLTVVAELKKQRIFRSAKTSYASLIHNVSGAIFPGSLVAIMGASGSGKTTMMSVLANRCPSGFHIDGDIRINNQPMEKFDKQISAYVYQDDLFINALTVMEHLNFAAKLRLDRNIEEKDRKRLIVRILKEMGLLKLANCRIGASDSEEGKTYLSGGERKRLSVATELLTEPMLLFCDEPTTGLDSFTALKITSMLQNLAINYNKTVICSIHQPNRQIFELFKQIILLSRGRIVFNGSPDDAMKFFQSRGYVYDEKHNPAEYLIKTIAHSRNLDEKHNDTENTLHIEFSNSEYYVKIKKYVDDVMKRNNSELSLCSKKKKTKPPSWLSKFITVLHRNSIEVARNSSPINIRIFQKILIAIMIGLCLNGTVQKTQVGLRAFQAAIFVTFTQNFYSPFYFTLGQIPDQLPLFYRENSNNSITPLMFYLSSIITMLPLNLIEPVSYSIIIYYLSGLRTDSFAVIMSSVVPILLFNISTAFGVLLSIFCKSKSIAVSFGAPLLNTLMFCSGLFIKLSSIPPLISWIQYISWFTYGCAAMYIIQLGDVYDIKCERNVPCLRTGRAVLKSFDYDEHSLNFNIYMMLILYFSFHVIAYLRLLLKIRTRTV